MKKLSTLILMVVVCGVVWGQESKIAIYPTNTFTYEEADLHHYGVGFRRLVGVENYNCLYGSGYFGVDLFTAGKPRLTIKSNGFVGIGTTSPNGLLHVSGHVRSIISSTADNNYFQYRWNATGDQAYVWNAGSDMKFGTASGFNAEAWNEKMRITSDGKVGIGTNIPDEKLHVKEGNFLLEMDYSGSHDPKVLFDNYNGGANIAQTFYRWSGVDARYYATRFHNEGENGFSIQIGGASKNIGEHTFEDILKIDNDGQVGIGTTTPNAKLDVAGNIKAHEIEVTLAAMQDLQLNGTLAANNITYTANGNTADFVFEDNYHLKDLSEVEAFIKSNKHLPEIPSASEMEEAGVNLAEMNKLLLMKVEELTLYSIQLEKEVEEEREERDENGDGRAFGEDGGVN